MIGVMVNQNESVPQQQANIHLSRSQVPNSKTSTKGWGLRGVDTRTHSRILIANKKKGRNYSGTNGKRTTNFKPRIRPIKR